MEGSLAPRLRVDCPQEVNRRYSGQVTPRCGNRGCEAILFATNPSNVRRGLLWLIQKRRRRYRQTAKIAALHGDRAQPPACEEADRCGVGRPEWKGAPFERCHDLTGATTPIVGCLPANRPSETFPQGE